MFDHTHCGMVITVFTKMDLLIMAIIHLKKMCVGVKSIDDFEQLIAAMLSQQEAAGLPREMIHTTRQMPKRAEELLQGGSLYWIIAKKISVRQELLDIRQYTNEEGKKYCQLVLNPELVPVTPKRHNRFQGWRYLQLDKTPDDIMSSDTQGAEEMPAALKMELAALGLL